MYLIYSAARHDELVEQAAYPALDLVVPQPCCCGAYRQLLIDGEIRTG